MIRIARLLLLATAATLAGCGVDRTALNFRSPRGSALSFQNAEGADVARVSFPGDVTLDRNDSAGGEATLTLSGAIRVDELIESGAIPSKARNSLVQSSDGVEVKVRGFYQVFGYSPTRLDMLAKHFVDLDRDTLIRLLSGQPVEVSLDSPSGQPVLKLTLGLGK